LPAFKIHQNVMTAAESKNIDLPTWYLIAGDDELTLKLRSVLVVGEDAQGMLRLDPKLNGERWLQISEHGASLVVTALRPDLSVHLAKGKHTPLHDGLELLPGTVITLPSNEIYVGHSMRRGRRVNHLVVEQKQAPLVAVEHKQPIVIPEPPILKDRLPTDDESAPIIVAEVSPPTSANTMVRRSVVKPIGYALLVAIGLVLLIYSVAQNVTRLAKPDEVVEPNNVRVLEAPKVQAPQPVAVPIAVPPEPLQAQEETEAVPQPDLTPTHIVQPVTEVPPPDQFVQTSLSKARDFMAKGFITAPPDRNAVMHLQLALYKDPTNAEALELMSIAAQRVLAAAVEGHQAGLEYEARNLLEELLAFHPEHAEANRLWREWVTTSQ
jgi:hypothetical protein